MHALATPYGMLLRPGSQYIQTGSTTVISGNSRRTSNRLRSTSMCPSPNEGLDSSGLMTTMPRGAWPSVRAPSRRQSAKMLRSTGLSGCSVSQVWMTVSAASCRLRMVSLSSGASLAGQKKVTQERVPPSLLISALTDPPVDRKACQVELCGDILTDSCPG